MMSLRSTTRTQRVWNQRPGALALALVALLGVTPARHARAATYAIVDLGTLGGDSSEAAGINGSSQIVGWSTTADGATHGFLYSGGTMTDLGTLPGGSASYATGINDQGQVVGYGGSRFNGDPMFLDIVSGFIWREGTMQPLTSLYCPCTFNRRYGADLAHAINAGGQVVGESETVRGYSVRHAALWQSPTQVEDIGGGAGDWSISRAYGINESGEVVGDFAQDAGRLTPPFDRRAFLWQAGVRQDLGTLPGHTSSQALGISATGQAIGWSGGTDGAQSHAVLWENGQAQDLGTLPGDVASQALGINAAGQVVGWSGSRAFLWQGGIMSDLNGLIPPDSGWVLARAAAINDRGDIVGTGLLSGQTRGFLLQPILAVAIDISPGDSPNMVKAKSKGEISVAVLSTSSFDAPVSVDPAALTFGRTGDERSWASCEAGGVDIDGDGLPDLLCHFVIGMTGFQAGDSEGVLKGWTRDGLALLGKDHVRIPGPRASRVAPKKAK